MKKSVLAGLLLLGASALSSTLIVAGELKSLRDSTALETASDAVEVKRNINDKAPIKRDYVQQPPLIPHKVKGYKINMKYNKCLTCHSWANYKKAGATKISLTHFEDRQGDEHSNVAARRYFCTQCHVPQADTDPLVQNEFKPVETIN